jgi:hypothetical protein
MPQALMRLRRSAEAVMGDLLQDSRRVAVLAADTGPDLAQALASRGTLHLLTIIGRTITCSQTTSAYDPAAVLRANPDCIVVVDGGICGWTDEQMQHRMTLMRDLRAYRIIMLVSNQYSLNLLQQKGISGGALCPDLRLCCPVRQTPPFAGSAGGLQKQAFPGLAACEATADGPDIQQVMRQVAPCTSIVTGDAGLGLLAWMMGKTTTLVLPDDPDSVGRTLAAIPALSGLILADKPPALSGTPAAAATGAGSKTKIFIAVCTCQKNRRARLPAIRSSWAANLPPDVTLRFFMGGAELPPGDELLPDEVRLDCPDSYDELPQKTFAILQYAAEQVSFDHLIKIDDDTMVMDLTELLRHALQADYVGALKGSDMTALHHLRRQNSQNKNPVPPELLRTEFMTGPLYCLSRSCVTYLAGLPRADIRELQEPVAYEDRMVGRLVTEAGGFSVYDAPELVRGYDEPATVRRLYLATTPDRTVARTDYPVSAQKLTGWLLRLLPGRLVELVWNFMLTNLKRIRRRLS